GNESMTLKAPGILTFVISIVLVVCVLMIKFFGASVPMLNGHEFWGLLIAHLILVLGCLVRSI
ncbi:hypothetical protein ABTL57_19285, partial [Acinetobacter baumannii]